MPAAKSHNHIISSIMPGSPASASIIAPGDVLRAVNGSKINDILDYRYYSYDSSLLLEVESADTVKLVRIHKPEGAELGLIFDPPLIDKERSCVNKCIFCFIDQMPQGMRKTLYYKDDDVRLSFLQGNYVTLTNLTRDDIGRLIRLKISPINISVHTMDRELHGFMLGQRTNADSTGVTACADALEYIKMLAYAGTQLNCQIVCCPGINDGQELCKTIEALIELGESINSVSVVPVGLAAHREGLFKLKPFDPALAKQTVELVEEYGQRCLDRRGCAVFYCADELYMLAGSKLPSHSYYNGYPQLENGVGMMRLFITQFMAAIKKPVRFGRKRMAVRNGGAGMLPVSAATGTLAAPYMEKLIVTAAEKYGMIDCRVLAVKNTLFGESVTVSGLVTGTDIATQLAGRELGSKLLIPRNMLRSGEDVFLDDMTVEELSHKLGVPVVPVDVNGKAFFNELKIYN